MGVSKMFYTKEYRYKDADFNGEYSEKLTKARDWLKDWRNKHNNLFICGTTGCGKTYLAMAFLNELSKDSKHFEATETLREWWNVENVEYVASKQLFDTIKCKFSTKLEVAQEARSAVYTWTKTQLLILDEIGLGYGTDSELIELTEMLDYRWKNGLPTVFMSNLSIQGLMDYFKNRASQRAFDDAEYVEIKSHTMRKKPKEL